MAKGTTCPSGPTAHKAYDDILKGTRSLGFEIGVYDDKSEYENFPDDWDEKSPQVQKQRAKRMFDNFKKEFNEEQNSIVLWGIPIPEYGIAYGYEGDFYLVSTFRHLRGIPETPIPYDKLEAPGSLHYFSFGKEIKINPDIRDKEAIERAIHMTEGVSYAHENYIAGPDAFVEWAHVLQTGRVEEELVYHGNSYVA
ncbi:MAG: hypothetical protein ACFE8N_15810, partial [Promethearchaeota archaeon]